MTVTRLVWYVNGCLVASSTFTLWVFGDAHVGTDLRLGRPSLADALRTSGQGEPDSGPPIDRDIAMDIAICRAARTCRKTLRGMGSLGSSASSRSILARPSTTETGAALAFV